MHERLRPGSVVFGRCGRSGVPVLGAQDVCSVCLIWTRRRWRSGVPVLATQVVRALRGLGPGAAGARVRERGVVHGRCKRRAHPAAGPGRCAHRLRPSHVAPGAAAALCSPFPPALQRLIYCRGLQMGKGRTESFSGAYEFSCLFHRNGAAETLAHFKIRNYGQGKVPWQVL
jgi:hypothetical protein